MTALLLTATTTGQPHVTLWLALGALLWLGWRLLLIALFPFSPCKRCDGGGKRRRGKYWRPCRRCDGTGRKIRLGRRAWQALSGTDKQRT